MSIRVAGNIDVKNRCGGYYLRWYYNGWHYWYFYAGQVDWITEGEDYRTLGTQRLKMGSGQLTQQQADAIRTIKNAIELYIWTDAGWWGAVRVEDGSVVVYDHTIRGYEIELSVIVGSRRLSVTGFSPVDTVPLLPSPIMYSGKYGALYNWYSTSELTNVLYGYLYNWFAATDVRNIANTGWHVPTEAELDTLGTFLGGDAVAGGKLKETGLTYWDTPNTGATNSSNFNGRGSGIRENTGLFSSINGVMWFWGSTGADPWGRYRTLNYNSANLGANGAVTLTILGLSIRLMKDSTTLSDGETATYTGNDGKIYRTICIGTQEWLADNLFETKYRNGDTIPEVQDNATWIGLSTGARCSYSNTESYAGTDTKLISSVGWNVPSYTDYDTLVTYLGGNLVAGGHMKQAGTIYWNSPNAGADDSVGLMDTGAGFSNINRGAFIGRDAILIFITSTDA